MAVKNKLALWFHRKAELNKMANEIQALTGYSTRTILRAAKGVSRATGKSEEQFLTQLKESALKGWFGDEL